MEEDNGRNVDGFVFADRENGSIAREEIQRINYISSRINKDNPEAILSVYNKMIESNTFFTPIVFKAAAGISLQKDRDR